MNRKLFKRLLKFVKPYLKFLILSICCAAVYVLAQLYTPVLIGRGVDLIIGPGQVDFAGLPALMLRLGICVAAGACFGWLTAYFNNIITYRTVRDLRVRLFDKFSRLPLSEIDGTPHGDFINRMVNDIDMVSDGLLSAFTQLFTGTMTILGTLVFMLTISPAITAAVVCLTPLSLFVASFIAKSCFKHFKKQSETQAELTAYINEYAGAQKLVRAFGTETATVDGFKEINSRLYKCGVRAQFFSAIANPSTRFVNGLVYAVTGVMGAMWAVSGLITVGQISTFLIYANQYTKPFNEISGVIAQLQSAAASAQRVFAVLDRPDEKPDAPDAEKSTSGEGSVEFRDVAFSYSPSRPLIKKLSFKAAPGSRVAIVGPTGCGKTTLINLLMRFYDVQSGGILVDSRDVRRYTRDALRLHFGMVLQDTWLFSGTIRENIAYAAPEATGDEIREAARRAHADGFIRRLSNGYDTVISSDGSSLSQGQRQLLCISRAMLSRAPMLILDEATSSIDTRTELIVQKAFTRLMEGKTCFIVAHRLSTIRSADWILVMKDGDIIEQGKHEDLMAQNGFYAGLYNAMNV